MTEDNNVEMQTDVTVNNVSAGPHVGQVQWFNKKKGYGFIERQDGEKDCFVHASAVREAGLRFLNENDEVEFEIQDGDKGPSAVNLKKTS